MVKKSRETVVELTEFRSLTKIHPESEASTESAVDIYDLMRKIREIFYSITPIKNKSQASAQMFEKLFAKPVIKASGLQKIDMSLAFQSLTGTSGVRFVNYLDFCHLMLHFYQNKLVKQYAYGGSFEEFIDACL